MKSMKKPLRCNKIENDIDWDHIINGFKVAINKYDQLQTCVSNVEKLLVGFLTLTEEILKFDTDVFTLINQNISMSPIIRKHYKYVIICYQQLLNYIKQYSNGNIFDNHNLLIIANNISILKNTLSFEKNLQGEPIYPIQKNWVNLSS